MAKRYLSDNILAPMVQLANFRGEDVDCSCCTSQIFLISTVKLIIEGTQDHWLWSLLCCMSQLANFGDNSNEIEGNRTSSNK